MLGYEYITLASIFQILVTSNIYFLIKDNILKQKKIRKAVLPVI